MYKKYYAFLYTVESSCNELTMAKGLMIIQLLLTGSHTK